MLLQRIAQRTMERLIIRCRGAAAGGYNVQAVFKRGHFLLERCPEPALDQVARDRVPDLLAD